MKIDININDSEIVKFTDKLEKLHKSDLPVTIKMTLNELAKDAKFNQMPKSVEDNFIVRNKRFLTGLTNYNLSPNTFNVNQMKSEVGLIGGRKNVGQRVAKQEWGGTISNRGNVPTDEVRIGKSESKKISRTYYLNKFNQSKKGVVFQNKKRRVIKTDKGLFQIEKGGIWKTLYYKKDTVKIEATNFIAEAAQLAHRNTSKIFIKLAEKRIAKRWKN